MDILDTTTKSKKRILNRFVPVIGRMPLLSSLKRCIFDVQSYNKNGIEPKNELDRLIVDILNNGSLQQYGYWLYACIDLVQENLDEIKKYEENNNNDTLKQNEEIKKTYEDKNFQTSNDFVFQTQKEKRKCLSCRDKEEKINALHNENNRLKEKINRFKNYIEQTNPKNKYVKYLKNFIQKLKKID